MTKQEREDRQDDPFLHSEEDEDEKMDPVSYKEWQKVLRPPHSMPSPYPTSTSIT